MATQKRSRQNKDITSEGEGMHPSDTISVAFCDPSELSCRWALRHGLFNSARGCRVPGASATVSSCPGAGKGEAYVNKGAPASHGGASRTPRGLLTGLPPPPRSAPRCSRPLDVLKADAALPSRVKPNRICITCDVHMTVQN